MNQNFKQDDISLNNRILDALSENDIQNFLIHTKTTDSEELFFVKKEKVLHRGKHVIHSDVTIYHDFEIDGQAYRGSFTFTANLNMSAEELSKKVKNAYTSAHSVKNPYYKLPSGSQMFSEHESDTAATSVSDLLRADDIAAVIYKNDSSEQTYINSLEIFVNHAYVHIINSNGVNVSFANAVYEGEFVAQSTVSEDVELYRDFKYSSKDTNLDDSLSEYVTTSLQAAHDRSIARPFADVVKDESYKKIILKGNCLYDLFKYYLVKSDASMIYPEYSKYAIDDFITSDVSNEKISMTLAPNIPYSDEGIELRSLNIIKDNQIRFITGNAMYAAYLGIEPTGTYDSYSLLSGDTSIEEMKSEPFLMVSDFSDFQMDEFTGAFGGEFRLGYYFDGETVTPVTAGSVNGNINELKGLKLSKETRNSYHYNGPVAISYNK